MKNPKPILCFLPFSFGVGGWCRLNVEADAEGPALAFRDAICPGIEDAGDELPIVPL